MKSKYKVNNFHNFISLPTEDERVPLTMEAGELNSLKPFDKSMTLEQIEHISKMTDFFETGRLEFDEEDEKELFEHLGIDDESQIFRARDIMSIIKEPTKEKLDRIIGIKELNTIDLFRGIITSIKNLGSDDISNRVMTTINKRRDEIYKNPSAESILVIKKTSAEINSEKKEEEMASKLEEIKAELEKEYDKKLKAELAKAKKATAKKETK